MEQLLTALIILPLTILAMNLLGAGHGLQENKFEWAILKQGLIKGVLIYAGIGVLAFIATLTTELVVVIGGASYGLVEALALVISGAITVYIVDIFDILLKIFKQPTKEVEE